MSAIFRSFETCQQTDVVCTPGGYIAGRASIPCKILVSEPEAAAAFDISCYGSHNIVTDLETVTPYIQTPSRDESLQASASQQG